jgi:GTP-binding protein Era
MPKAGFVTVAGLPNAGKSTLLNRLVGQKLAITSSKPQSTRDRVVGIVTDGDCQIVVLDTPGLMDPTYPLQRAMRGVALKALDDADLVVQLCDAGAGPAPDLVEMARLGSAPHASVLKVYNKSDVLSDGQRQVLAALEPNALFISASTGEGLELLLAEVRRRLPEHPFFFGSDDASTQSTRFFVTEFIREAAFELLEEELPYAIACEIEEFREDRQPMYIRAVLYVERESQKRILIGAGGAQIRDLGKSARGKIESLVQQPVYLDLWVKVLHNWRRNAPALNRLGYLVPEEQRS